MNATPQAAHIVEEILAPFLRLDPVLGFYLRRARDPHSRWSLFTGRYVPAVRFSVCDEDDPANPRPTLEAHRAYSEARDYLLAHPQAPHHMVERFALLVDRLDHLLESYLQAEGLTPKERRAVHLTAAEVGAQLRDSFASLQEELMADSLRAQGSDSYAQLLQSFEERRREALLEDEEHRELAQAYNEHMASTSPLELT